MNEKIKFILYFYYYNMLYVLHINPHSAYKNIYFFDCKNLRFNIYCSKGLDLRKSGGKLWTESIIP